MTSSTNRSAYVPDGVRSSLSQARTVVSLAPVARAMSGALTPQPPVSAAWNVCEPWHLFGCVLLAGLYVPLSVEFTVAF